MPVCRLTPLIGRQAEIDALREAYADVSRGSARVVLLGGEAGAGKTRLVTDFLEEIDSPALVGGCVELSQAAVPYLPLASALRSLAEQRGADEMHELVGGPARPLLQLLPRLDSDSMSGMGPDPLRLFEAVPELMDRLAPTGPAVLVFEDLHWADASTLDLVRFLATGGLRGRLLIFTYRSDEMRRMHPLRPVLAELSRLSEVVRIDVEPLSDDDVVSMVDQLVRPGGMGVPLDEILRRAEGNPFFVEELVTCCAYDRASLETSLGDVLLNRLDHLPEAAIPIAEVVAVTGRWASHQLVETVAGLDSAALTAGLRSAIDDGAIVADAGGEHYRFRHALLREAAYERMLAGTRRMLHKRLSAALMEEPALAEGGAQAAAGEIAFHAEKAGDIDTAYRASLRAAERAAESFAVTEADAHYERAVGLHDQASPNAQIDGADLRERAARTAQVVGDFARAAQHLRVAVELAEDDPTRAVALLVRLGEVLWFNGNPDEGLAVHNRALELVGDTPGGLRAEVRAFIGLKRMLREDYPGALEIGLDALAEARTFENLPAQVRALEAIGCTRALTGVDSEQGLGDLREAVRLAKVHGDTEYVVHASVNLGASLEFLGQVEEARAWDRACVAEYAELGLVGAAVDFQRCNLAWGLIRVGEWDEAESVLRRLRFSQHAGNVRLHQQVCSAVLAATRGHLNEARAYYDAARPVARAFDSLQFLAPLAWVRMVLAVGTEDFADAARDLVELEAVRPVHPYYGDLARRLVDHALQSGDVDHVEATLVELEQRIARAADAIDPLAEQAHAAHRRNRRWIAAERARLAGEQTVEAWAAVLDAGAEDRFIADDLYLRYRLAAARIDAGEDAHDLLIDTFSCATALGCPIADKLASLARRARIRLPGLERDAAAGVVDHGLTEREREVLALLTGGSTNREIAAELFISAKTASVHVSNILGKLGAANRTEAAAIARELGVTA